MTLVVYLIFYKLIFFETLIFLESKIKLITGIFDFLMIILIMTAQVLFSMFFLKKTHTLMLLSL